MNNSELDPRDVVEGLGTLVDLLDELEQKVVLLLAVDGGNGLHDAKQYADVRHELMNLFGEDRIKAIQQQIRLR